MIMVYRYLRRLEKLPHKQKKKEVIYEFISLRPNILQFEGLREFIYQRADGSTVIVTEAAIGHEFMPHFASKTAEISA